MKRTRTNRKKLFIIRAFFLLTLLFSTITEIKAASRYWVATVNSNWNNTANWATTSSGTSGASVPGAADIVFFDGGSSSDCTVDIAVTIGGFTIYSSSTSTIDINGQVFNIIGASNNIFQGGEVNDGAGTSTLSINCTGTTTFSGTTVGADITVVSSRLYLNGSTFSGTSIMEKTGALAEWGAGGNIFNGTSELINSGSGTFAIGNTNPDTFNTNLTLTNTGSNDLILASNSVNNRITGNLTANNSSSSADATITLASTASSALNITGTCTITNDGTGANITSYIGSNGDVTFGGTLTLRNLGTGANSAILVHNNPNSNNQYNGGLVLECDQTNKGIRFGQNSGNGTLASGETMSIGALGFTTSFLWLKNFTQIGSTTQTIVLTGTTDLALQSGNIFNGNVNFTSPKFRIGASTFNGTTTILHKTGSTYDWCFGGTTYNTNLEIKNSGTGAFDMANSTADDYNGDVTYTKTSSGLIYGANNTACTYAGDINLNTNSAITLASNTNGRVILDGTGVQTINNTGTTPSATIKRLTLNKTGGKSFLNFPITVGLDLTFTQGFMVTTSTNLLTLNDDIVMSGASDLSYISGPVKKIGNDGFTFPVGDTATSVYAPITISAPTNVGDAFTATYFNTNPNSLYSTTLRDATLEHVSLCEYWTLDRTTGTSNVSVKLSWDTRSCGVTHLAELRVSRWDGTKWKDHGSGGTTGGTTSGTVISSGAISTFSPFTLASTTTNNPLPIDLISFIATLDRDRAYLEWKTASEANNDYFTIEKSKNALDWEELLTTKGAGTSNQINNYFETDYNLLDGVSYYRLKQTDFDRTYTYSGVIKVVSSNNSISIYPNPTRAKISIQTKANELASIKIYNSIGQDVTNQINQHSKSVNGVIIDLSSLTNGLYIVKTGTTTNKVYKE